MFGTFFHRLRDQGIPVTPTAFLRLHKALSLGIVCSLEDLYVAARAILLKSERHFDLYDQVFSQTFRGVVLQDGDEDPLAESARALLAEWLDHPQGLAEALGLDMRRLQRMTPEALVQYFLDRLREQKGPHQGGDRWIGSGGASPVGQGGRHPGGMRVGGASRGKSAVKVALERRWRDYSQDGPLTECQMGEALKRLRRMTPSGPRDVVNVGKTIAETLRNAGDIEIVFDRRLRDRLKIALFIDNGGWSMEPYVPLVQTLFRYARSQFKDLQIFYFHNTVYGKIWADPQRHRKPVTLEAFVRRDAETRLVLVGDASMAPYELMGANGTLYAGPSDPFPSIERLRFLARHFRHAVWLNPQGEQDWDRTWTVGVIRDVFPMFALSLDGLDKAVSRLMAKH